MLLNVLRFLFLQHCFSYKAGKFHVTCACTRKWMVQTNRTGFSLKKKNKIIITLFCTFPNDEYLLKTLSIIRNFNNFYQILLIKLHIWGFDSDKQLYMINVRINNTFKYTNLKCIFIIIIIMFFFFAFYSTLENVISHTDGSVLA